MQTRIFDAIKFATEAHTGQFRKGTKLPYIVHPLSVMTILIEAGCDEDVVIAGILHDVVEDAKIPFHELEQRFGAKVANIVNALTEPTHLKRDASSWKERKLHSIELLKNTNDPEILLVALADKYDNSVAILKDIKKIGDELWKRFNAPKQELKWYYYSLKELFAEKAKVHPHKVEPLASQFARVVEEIFG